jgi:hypothetical protein
MRLGDAAHMFILFNTSSFMVAVVMQSIGALEIFAPSWEADGFCIANKDTSLAFLGRQLPLSSHALCFYSDAVFAIGLWALSRAHPDVPSMKPVADAGPGIFGHGAAHLALWALGDAPFRGPPLWSDSPPWKLAASAAGLCVFYFLLFRTFSLRLYSILLNSLAHAIITALLVPPSFAFTCTVEEAQTRT